MKKQQAQHSDLDSNGFSLLELIVTLVIITMLAIMLSSHMAGIVGGASNTCALEEMNNIKRAVTDMFYSNLGCLPEDLTQPWYSTRFLCLRDDRDDAADDPDEIESPECYDMWTFLGGDNAAKARLVWDRYKQKGWNGPYMDQDVSVRLDPDGAENPRGLVFLPLVATPWFDKCETLAKQREDEGDVILAEEYRRGRYYFILTDKDKDGSPVKDTARIFCFGANCLDDGSYYRNYAEGEFATVDDLRKPNIDDPDDSSVYFTNDDLMIFIFGGGPSRGPLD